MRKFILSIFCLIFLFSAFSNVSAQNIEIDFFYSSICPHCIKEKAFLEDLEIRYSELKVNYYEVMSSSENQELLMVAYGEYSVPSMSWGSVPVTFTPTEYFIGFSDQISKEIENCLVECMGGETTDQQGTIDVPFFGSIDISKMSLPVLTIVIAALDGFNPCAMWVLVFLLTLLINSKSRKRMFLIGGTFVFVSGVVYFLILSAWLNLFLAISYVNITRVAIGLLAVGVGVWQIKNFIQYKPGVCKVTDGKGVQERLKEKLKSGAEKIALSPFTFLMLGGTILLALGVNLVEFFCSAGLPAIYTKVLSLSEVGGLGHYMYLLLYTFVFMLDDIIILTVAIITLSKFGFTEKYNYWSTLIGGILILLLGILLIFNPGLLMFA